SCPIAPRRAAMASPSSRGRVTRMRIGFCRIGSFAVKDRPMAGKTLTILGIETSCDETAAAVVRGTPPFAPRLGGGGYGKILSSVVASQIAAHAPYGGVV